MKSYPSLAVLSALIFASVAFAQGKGPHVFFPELKNGAEVAQKVKVKFGVEGIKIRPAGEAPDEKTSGHHHLLIDLDSIPAGTPIPTDAQHLHFGKGQTEAEVTLSPGKHKLTLQFADGAHRSYGKDLSASVTVTAK